MASVTDIITYVGIPLAVVGVLPILYTFILAIFTRRKIRHALVQHGHKPLNSSRRHDGFTIRSSPMTTLLEVELPRYMIAPLERDNDDYWRPTRDGQDQDDEHQRLLLSRAESTLSMVEEGRVRGFLRGGSWRAFHWKKLIVGKKLYRIQFEDELREPAAEIDFANLVHFLLDWGAVPNANGWQKLKSGGLWTPAGTVLLEKAPDSGVDTLKSHADWVLRTTMPDESDGVLSLTIKWSKDAHPVCDVRGATSLPPGWGRLNQPAIDLDASELEEKPSSETRPRRDLPTRIQALKLASKHSLDSTSFRFSASDNLVHAIHWESANICTGCISHPFATDSTSHPHSATATWFTAAAACLLSHRSQAGSGLWTLELPERIAALARHDSVPCGILVLLGILDEADAPQWSSDQGAPVPFNAAQRHHQRFLAQRDAERLEATMPPDQARVHRMNRESEFRRQQHADMLAQVAERRERDEKRITDAIASPRMGVTAVAEACLAWLIRQGEVPTDWDVGQLAEAVLYLMVVGGHGPDDGKQTAEEKDQEGQEEQQGHPEDERDDKRDGNEAYAIVHVLEEWLDWGTVGTSGMQRQQYVSLHEYKREFCLAASIVAVIHAAAHTARARANVDIMDCLRLWRTVKLG